MASARPPLTELVPWFKGASGAPINQDNAMGWPFCLTERNIYLSENLRYTLYLLQNPIRFFKKRILAVFAIRCISFWCLYEVDEDSNAYLI
jgi:hypothetical protein